jgi:hypothetical protein
MFQPIHCGLFFSSENIHTAQKHKQRAPFTQAWDYLKDHNPANDLEVIQLDGLRFRYENDAIAGERALGRFNTDLMTRADQNTPLIIAIADTLALMQCFEMLRDHPTLDDAKRAQWLEAFEDQVRRLSDHPDDGNTRMTDRLWRMTLNIAAGIVLEQEDTFTRGVAQFCATIDDDVHPEGYIPAAVEQFPEAESLENQLLCVQALILSAEMAHHCGVHLWEHQKRGVSVLTAATYPLYYYFYPEKWKWNGEQWKPSEGVEADVAERLFKKYNGFFEILNLRYGHPLKALELITDDLRPIYDPYGGGLTTLTHGVLKRHGLFG